MGTSGNIKNIVKCLVLLFVVLTVVECSRVSASGRRPQGKRPPPTPRPRPQITTSKRRTTTTTRPTTRTTTTTRPTTRTTTTTRPTTRTTTTTRPTIRTTTTSHPPPNRIPTIGHPPPKQTPSSTPNGTVDLPSPFLRVTPKKNVTDKPTTSGSYTTEKNQGKLNKTGILKVDPSNIGFNKTVIPGTGNGTSGNHKSENFHEKLNNTGTPKVDQSNIGFNKTLIPGTGNGTSGNHNSENIYGKINNTSTPKVDQSNIGFNKTLIPDSSTQFHGSNSTSINPKTGSIERKQSPNDLKPNATVGPPTNEKFNGTSPPAQLPPNKTQSPDKPSSDYNPAGYGPSPDRGSPGSILNISIQNINTNNHHYEEGPKYQYSSGDVGKSAIGFYLGYKLAKLTTPTYSHSSFHDEHSSRYDHYEIHHYYHNRGPIARTKKIEPNAIVGCIGDSGAICPTGTTSLCTNNGVIRCVASATTIVRCSDLQQGYCVKSTIPCINGTENCIVGTSKTVILPCISTAQVSGSITYINNTIIVNNTNITNNNFNITNGTITTSNSSTVLAASNNITANIPLTFPPNITTNSARTRRDTVSIPVNEFCVTIVAIPAKSKPKVQESILSKGVGILVKFFVKAHGAD